MWVITVFIMRLFGPLTILKWPFWGIVLALALDAVDGYVVLHLEQGRLVLGYAAYQRLDKFLDLYMFSIALYAIYHWNDRLAKAAAVSLYFLRFVGVAAFELTQSRLFLVIFPNTFEFFFLYYAYRIYRQPQYHIGSRSHLFGILLLLTIPKLIQEYVLHIEEARPWVQFKTKVLDFFSVF